MAKSKSNSRSAKEKPVTSSYCKPSGSTIHQQGLFATRKIPADTEIIRYVGEKVSKKEGDKRAIDLAEKREGSGDASVYMFILDDEYDIDGNVPHNTARLINHSCDPNCEAQIIDDEIWIVSLREIKRGTELTFDYGFDLEHFEDHPCRCGSPQCVGYIVAHEYWPKLEKKLAAKRKRALRAAKKTKKAGSASPASASKAGKKRTVKGGSAPGAKKPEKKVVKKAASLPGGKRQASRKTPAAKKKAPRKAASKSSPGNQRSPAKKAKTSPSRKAGSKKA